MKPLRKFLLLSQTERSLVLKTAFLLFVTRIGLALLPFQLLRQTLLKTKIPSELKRSSPLRPSRIGWAVAAAGRYVPGGRRCLVQALVAERLLRSYGLPACLRIGVGNDQDKKFQAHAWVESAGQVVIGGSALTSYTPLVAFEQVIADGT